jgi:hypothetical protein
MADAGNPPRPIATLALRLLLADDGGSVMPPRELTTGIKRGESALTALRKALVAAAEETFASPVVLDGLRFTDVGDGRVTTHFTVVAEEPTPIAADQYAGGITRLIDQARRPLETYLRAVMAKPDLKVSIEKAFLEQSPAPSADEAVLTVKQQKRARWIAGGMLGVAALYVLAVLYV